MREVIFELKRLKAKKVFIQYPEGLKTKIQEISKQLEKEGFGTLIDCEPTYGGCDVRDVEAKRLGCDVILHIGHSDFGIKSEIPVVYWDYFIDIDPIPILKKEIDKLRKFNKIGLVTSLQFVPAMEKTKQYLEKIGKKVFVHKTLKYLGQVLGCCVYAAEAIENKVDCFLYVGTGRFHPLGVSLKVKKPVFSLDLEKREIYNLEKEKMKYLKKKAWKDYQLEKARKIGIIVSWKKGQNRIKEAEELKKKLEKKGKEVYILAFDSVSKEKIIGMKFDAIVNIACPRIEDENLLS